MKFIKGLDPLIAGLIALALVVGLAWVFWPGGGTREITADFPRTVSLYKGSDVRILGIPVGKVDSVTPSGTKVLVKISYDAKYKVPADAKAVVISPSIVGDRYVQLTPVYKSGPTLADNAHLGLARTATPLELDEIFGSLNDLDKALGPDGANAPGTDGVGALTRLLDSTAKNFGGQGVQFNQTIKNLGKFTKTLADNKNALFGSATEIEKFVNKLSTNDTTVRKFTDSLAQGSVLLADERADLGAALHNLGVALTSVRGFVSENKTLLTSNISKLNTLSQILVKRRTELNEVLKDAPAALNNLSLAYNPTTHTLDTRAALGEVVSELTTDPASVLCGIVDQAPGGSSLCSVLTGALKGLGRTGPLSKRAEHVSVVEPIDPTLGGLVK
jgi:virulence factor Mce-like protein